MEQIQHSRGEEEVRLMCWNCGCMMPDNDMGNPDSITTEKLRKGARAGGNNKLHQSMENMEKRYEEKIKNTPGDTETILAT